MENENEQKLEINTKEVSVRAYDTQENRDESKDKFPLNDKLNFYKIVHYLLVKSRIAKLCENELFSSQEEKINSFFKDVEEIKISFHSLYLESKFHP